MLKVILQQRRHYRVCMHYCCTLNVLGHDTMVDERLQNSIKQLNKLCKDTQTVQEVNVNDEVNDA